MQIKVNLLRRTNKYMYLSYEKLISRLRVFFRIYGYLRIFVSLHLVLGFWEKTENDFRDFSW